MLVIIWQALRASDLIWSSDERSNHTGVIVRFWDQPRLITPRQRVKWPKLYFGKLYWKCNLFFILTQVPFIYMERAGFMTCTAAARHQEAIKEPTASICMTCEAHPIYAYLWVQQWAWCLRGRQGYAVLMWAATPSFSKVYALFRLHWNATPKFFN